MKLINYPLVVFLFLMTNSCLFAQSETPELKEFKITVEKDEGKILLECEKGCAWLKLSYRNNVEEQPIDQNGMANSGHIIPADDSKLAHFILPLPKRKEV